MGSLLALILTLGAAGGDAATANVLSPDEIHRQATRAFEAGEIALSAERFDRLVELDPKRVPTMWQRGITLYYAGRLQDCIDQFTRHREVNPHDAENSAWHFLCNAKVNGLEQARTELIPARDYRVPLMAIHALYGGGGSVESVLREVDKGNPDPRERRVRTFYAHLYLAIWYDAQNDTVKTRHHLERALDGPDVGHYMEIVARVHLDLLRSKP